jgi:hypothetical protein
MINFNELPNSKPAGFTTIPKGRYLGTIEKAEMRVGKDTSKPPYLSIQWGLAKDGKPMGKFFDLITEPGDAEIPRYKLKRFIQALELPITGNFTLADLAKMVPNKSAFIDITVDEKSDPARNQVDVFTGEIYYSINDANATVDEVDAEDAADVADFFPQESADTISGEANY